MSNELFAALIAGSLAGGGGGSTETDDYNNLKNKPKINGTKLEGNLSLSDIGAATSDQGDKADSAVQPEDLGSAATADTSDFATAAQGGKADSAIQGIKVNSTTVNPDGNKVVNITIPTKAADVSALPDTTKYASALRLTINSSTFVVTGQLIDQDGNDLGTAQTIDLPLESVVVDGSYNSQTKKVVLTLQNGNTIEFSVADLVSGLQTELSASNKLNPAYINYDSTHAAVTEAQRAQIATNQTNILNIENENRNKLPYTLDSLKTLNTTGTWSNNVYTINNLAFTVNSDMSISVDLVSGDTPTLSTFYLCDISKINLDSIKTYFGYATVDYSTNNYFGLYGVAGVPNLILNAGADIPSDYANKYTHAIIRISAALSLQYQLWKPMIVEKSIYTAGITSYTPYTPSNRELYDNLGGSDYIVTASGRRLYISDSAPTGEIPVGSIGVGW